MPEIDFSPFGPDIVKGQRSDVVNRAIWCCIAPYILYPQHRIPRENVRTFYLAKILIDLDGLPKKKLQARDRRIIEDTRKLHDLMGWIRALIDAPSSTDVRDFEWGRKNELTRNDYLTVHRVILLYLRMQRNPDKDVWLSMENAKIICQSEPLQDRHSGRNKIDAALRDYKKSSSLIFGMLQALANDGIRTALLVPQRTHVEALCEKGHEYVQDGLRYATYAQRVLTTAKPRNSKKAWLSKGTGWMLPDMPAFEQEEIGKLLQPLTEQEKSYVRNAPERIKKRSATPRPPTENPSPVPQEQ